MIAREWHSKQAARWTEVHTGRMLDRLEKDLFPHLGARPINATTAPELLAVLRRKGGKGAAYTAKRLRQISNLIDADDRVHRAMEARLRRLGVEV